MAEYTALASKLPEKPTFACHQKVLSPEISQFRGYKDDLDESEKRRATVRQEQHDLGQAARDARSQSYQI